MSTFSTCTSNQRPTSSLTDGDVLFETDTKNIIIWDGSNWVGYEKDFQSFGSNSYVAELDGNNQYLTLGDVSGTLGGATKCSVSWWMKQPTISSGATNRRIWQMGDLYDNLAISWAGSFFSLIVGTGSGSLRTTKTTAISAIDDDTWHLWTVVYDGSQPTDTTKLVFYKDTTPQTTATDSGPIPTSLPSTTGDDPHIGALLFTSINSAPYDFSDASFDDFAIFDDVLTSTQIADIYNNQIYPSSLKHLYRFENNVNDSVGGTNFNGSDVNGPSITNSPSGSASEQFPY